MPDALFRTTLDLAQRFGPLTSPTVKPYSASIRTADQSLIIKVYRGIEPVARRQRETDALLIAPTLGLAVPDVIEQGECGDHVWTAFEIVPGQPGTALATAQFCSQATRITARLHCAVAEYGAGSGWTGTGERRISNRCHLTAQLSYRAQAMPWWPNVYKQLSVLDDQPAVYLHGDLKPEHLIASDTGTYVVDWEACARGPAACDYADVIFHLIRDLTYADIAVATVPIATPHGLPAALAWRTILWADRRRPVDLIQLPPDALVTLAKEQPHNAIEAAAKIVHTMRRLGTPP